MKRHLLVWLVLSAVAISTVNGEVPGNGISVRVNGLPGTNFTFVAGRQAVVTIESTLPRPTIFYTLDGSRPSPASALYLSPLTIRSNATVWAIAYGSDFSNATGQPVVISFEGEIQLEVSVQGFGTVLRDPNRTGYSLGEEVMLTAVAEPYSTFVSWENGETSTNRVIVIGATNQVSATFTNFVALEEQFSFDFEETFTSPSSHVLRPLRSEWAGDHFLIAGTAQAGRNNSYFIVKTDREGHSLAEQFYWGTDDDNLYDFIQLDGGRWLLAGLAGPRPWPGTRTAPVGSTVDPWLVAIGGEGTQLFDTTIQTPVTEGTLAAASLRGGGVFLASYVDPYYPSPGLNIARLDWRGGLVWSKSYPELTNRVPVEGFELTDGLALLTRGYATDGAGNTVGQMHLHGFGNDGTWKGEHLLASDGLTPGWIADARMTANGTLIVLYTAHPHAYVYAYDLNGTRLWSRRLLPETNGSLNGVKIVSAESDELLILIQSATPPPPGGGHHYVQARLVRLSGEGTVLSDHFLTERTINETVSLALAPRRGLLTQSRIVTDWSGNIYSSGITHTSLRRHFVPVGTPQILIDKSLPRQTTLSNQLSYSVSIESRGGGATFYSLDGSTNIDSARRYVGPFSVSNSVTIQAMTRLGTNLYFSAPLPLHILPNFTVVSLSRGGGTVYTDRQFYPSNSVAIVNAAANQHWYFAGWRGEEFSGRVRSQTNLLMDRNHFVDPVFGTTLTTTTNGAGRINRFPPPTPYYDAGFYEYGDQVQLVAIPEPGHYFALWGQDAAGTSSSLWLTITNGFPRVAALFTPLAAGEVALTVFPNGRGEVQVNPEKKVYRAGEVVTLRAVATAGRFLGWSGGVTNGEPEITLTLDSDKVVAANFEGGDPRLLPAGLYLGVSRGGPFSRAQVELFSRPGLAYRLESSPDLQNWAALGEGVLTNGHVSFPLDSERRAFFYRVRPR